MGDLLIIDDALGNSRFLYEHLNEEYSRYNVEYVTSLEHADNLLKSKHFDATFIPFFLNKTNKNCLKYLRNLRSDDYSTFSSTKFILLTPQHSKLLVLKDAIDIGVFRYFEHYTLGRKLENLIRDIEHTPKKILDGRLASVIALFAPSSMGKTEVISYFLTHVVDVVAPLKYEVVGAAYKQQFSNRPDQHPDIVPLPFKNYLAEKHKFITWSRPDTLMAFDTTDLWSTRKNNTDVFVHTGHPAMINQLRSYCEKNRIPFQVYCWSMPTRDMDEWHKLRASKAKKDPRSQQSLDLFAQSLYSAYRLSNRFSWVPKHKRKVSLRVDKKKYSVQYDHIMLNKTFFNIVERIENDIRRRRRAIPYSSGQI